MEKPNFSQIDQIAGGDTEFKTQLLAVIKKEFPLEKQLYLDSLKDENYDKVAEIVHKLKHKISILGLEKSYEIAVLYENSLREGKLLKKQEFEIVLLTISEFLSTLKS
ncbi:Hpt domain-containing protein [Wenyingzhuangia sp. IMCC45533]